MTITLVSTGNLHELFSSPSGNLYIREAGSAKPVYQLVDGFTEKEIYRALVEDRLWVIFADGPAVPQINLEKEIRKDLKVVKTYDYDI